MVNGITEGLGFITGTACVYLTLRENIWNFPLGLANNPFFLVLFLQGWLFGDAGLQVIYLTLGIQAGISGGSRTRRSTPPLAPRTQSARRLAF